MAAESGGTSFPTVLGCSVQRLDFLFHWVQTFHDFLPSSKLATDMRLGCDQKAPSKKTDARQVAFAWFAGLLVRQGNDW